MAWIILKGQSGFDVSSASKQIVLAINAEANTRSDTPEILPVPIFGGSATHGAQNMSEIDRSHRI